MKREQVVLVVLSLAMLCVSMWPWVRFAIWPPQDRHVFLAHNSADYWTYTSFIKQGIDGHTTTYNLFFAEKQPGSYLFYFYLVLGHIGRFVGITDPELLYHLFRAILSVIWMYTLYRFCRYFTSNNRETFDAYVLVLTSASFPLLTKVGEMFQVGWFFDWWTEWSPVKRIAFLPHYLFGHILLVLVVLLFFHAKKTRKPVYVFAAFVAGWVLGFVHTPSLMILLLILPIHGLLTRDFRWIVSSFGFAILSLTSLLIVNSQSRGIGWIVTRNYESLSFSISLPDAILGLGPVILLAGIGAWFARKKPFVLLFILWIAISIAMIRIAWWMRGVPPQYWWVHKFPISNIRFLQTALWVPLAVLGSYGLSAIQKNVGVPAYRIVLCVFVFLTFIGYPSAIQRAGGDTIGPVDDYTAPPIAWYKAVKSLDTTRDDAAILSIWHAGERIPALTGRRTYTGRPGATPDFDNRLSEAWQFYADMDTCRAWRFVTDNNISTVFYGFDEQKAGSHVSSYPFLKLRSPSDAAAIYDVVQWNDSSCF